MFVNNSCSIELPLQIDPIEETIENVYNSLHDCATRSRRGTTQEVDNLVLEKKWERIVHCKDDLKLWKAINWRGGYVHDFHNDGAPSDDVGLMVFHQEF